MFFCREKELSDLNRRYRTGNFEFAVIYGRRRIGKTALIKEFCKGKSAIFFSALNSGDVENLKLLSREIYEYEHPDAQEAPVYKTFKDAFDHIGELAKSKRLIFVIDEYPYLANARESVSSLLQHIIDHDWTGSRLFLILCGSSMSFMENQILGYQSPLYGRRTAQYKIHPLTYRETAVFNKELPALEQALIYGITGGIPHYINRLNVKNDLDEALLENLFSPSGYLFEETENLLKHELREPAMYNSVISAVANGASHANEISTRVGLESGICSKYIRVLIDLEILKKETPITEKVGKKTIYTIKDNLFRFWYFFVPRNMSAIVTGRIENIYDTAIKSRFPDYMGLVFEQMCREYLLHYAKKLPIMLSNVGQWWGTDSKEKKQVQIDIVGTPADGDEYIIGSCKYRNELVDVDELKLLQKYASVFGKGSRYHYFLFSKSGFTNNLAAKAKRENATLVTLEDMYATAIFY